MDNHSVWGSRFVVRTAGEPARAQGRFQLALDGVERPRVEVALVLWHDRLAGDACGRDKVFPVAPVLVRLHPAQVGYQVVQVSRVHSGPHPQGVVVG
jgi:hypothetical protein